MLSYQILTECLLSLYSICLANGLFLSTGASLPHPLKLGAFNGHTFGRAKMKNAQNANVFSKIVARYDIFLLEEIRDITGTAITTLLNLTSQITPYNYTLSGRLGRKPTYKEQYAFFYRLDRVKLIDTWQYDDPSDIYEREPYCARFKPIGMGVTWDLAVVGLHTKPDSEAAKLTVKEIGGLTTVKERLQVVWSDVHDVVIMGDFNADCHYVSESDLTTLPIYNQTQFHWLIDFGQDTTTGRSDCAYDRIVVSGPHITNAVVNGSAQVYHFENDFNLTSTAMIHASDHYPVEFTIQ